MWRCRFCFCKTAHSICLCKRIFMEANLLHRLTVDWRTTSSATYQFCKKFHIAILFLAWFFRKIKNKSMTQLPRAGMADSAKAKTDMAMQFLLPLNCTNKNKLTRFLKSNRTGIGQNLNLKILKSNILANQNFCEFWQTRHEIFFFFFFHFRRFGLKIPRPWS